MTKTPDEVLVGQARDGDEAAFAELIDRHSTSLKACVRRQLPALLKRKLSESDVLQAAYLTAFQKLGTFEDRGEGSFRAWLDRIVEFKVRAVIGRFHGTAKRAVGREVTRARRPETHQAVGKIPSASAVVMARELRDRVERGMAQLPEHYRDVIRMVRHEGLPLAEVGRRMNRSPKAVAKLHARALQRLTEIVFANRTEDSE